MSEPQERAVPRDFLYLDVERTRSVFAQLEGGLVTGRETSTTKSKGGGADIGGGVPGLVNAKLGGKYLWENEERETKTLHDYVFLRVEETLGSREAIVDISEESPSVGHIPDGSFLRITGSIRIDDYDRLRSMLERFNDLARFIGSLPSTGTANTQREPSPHGKSRQGKKPPE